MATNNAKALKPSASTHKIRAIDIAAILSHRLRDEQEEYLVRWRTQTSAASSLREAVCSWHGLSKLTRALHRVQQYVENRPRATPLSRGSIGNISAVPSKRKRSSLDNETTLSRDTALGIITPSHSSDRSRATSVIASESSEQDAYVYNGVLERREGWIVAKKSKRVPTVEIDATTLPTPQMMEEASHTPPKQAASFIREAFERKLRRVGNLSLMNEVDSTTPSLGFQFVNAYVLGDGVYRADPETYEGCQKPCRPNMGQHIGCELPRACGCLEYAAVDEDSLRRDEPQRHAEYARQMKEGEFVDKTNLPKRFPYKRPQGGYRTQALQRFYLESRHAIYECNVNCNCGPACKSRLVQKGRHVPLIIFKTPNRGWGVRCSRDLIEGEFIDTYLGELITNDEAEAREQAGAKDKASYLYSLDKFVGDDPDITADNCYVVDGQYKGGVTRFINHSCEPNCRQYTVSFNKNDARVYDLAFFAIEDIPAGRELTFDYLDKDEEEEDEVIAKREAAARDPNNVDKVPCNCGATKCRGFLWV